MPRDELVVNEIFFSLQGESTYAGELCTFVRLSGCDLRCKWCDTKYAFHEGTTMSVEEVLDQVDRYPSELVEITGGEPLLQKATHTLIQRLLDIGKKVLVETGGHLDVSQVDKRAKLIHDIKCPDSGMSEKNRWDNLSTLGPNDEIKFVLASRRDYDWAKEVVKKHDLTGSHVVLFSPVWETLSPQDLAEWTLQDGLPVRVQLQLHKILWGDQRGR
jgi:7-carboxy-7-deazaguanine synthase